MKGIFMDEKKLIDRIYSGNEVSFDDITRLLKSEGNARALPIEKLQYC